MVEASSLSHDDEPLSTVNVVAGETWWQQWSWQDGKLIHFVPMTWTFPTGITPKRLWDLWFFGDRGIGIRPYRLIHRTDISIKDKMHYSRANSVINFIKKIMEEENINCPGKTLVQWTILESDECFQRAWIILKERLYQRNVAREHEVSYGTIYNKICKSRKVSEP